MAMGVENGPGRGRRRLGDFLLDQGILSAPSLERALAAQKRAGTGVKLGGLLLGSGLVTEKALLEALSRAHRCPAVDWVTLSRASPDAVVLLTGARATRLGAFPYALERRTLRVAFADPSNIAAIDEVAAVTGYRVVPAVTCEVRLMQAHERFYGRTISRQFSNILHRLENPRVEIRPQRPRVPPPPPPRLSEPEQDDAVPSGGQLPSEVLGEVAPPAAFPFGYAGPPAESVADAPDSSARKESRPRIIEIREEGEEEIPFDLGDPLPDAPQAEREADPKSSSPSRSPEGPDEPDKQGGPA